MFGSHILVCPTRAWKTDGVESKMTFPEPLTMLAGRWKGTSRLWLDPESAPAESETTATVTEAARGRALAITYAWSHEGEPQEGILLLAGDAAAIRAAWVDSFHVQEALMLFEGAEDADGGVLVRGSYPAPSGPDWGWTIRVEPLEGGAFRIVMHNVTPEGEEQLAVASSY